MSYPPPTPSAVPSIRIHGADDPSALFDGGDMFSTDINIYLQDPSFYACSRGLQADFLPVSNVPAELEDLTELSHLSTTNQPFLTGYGYSLPYPGILQEKTGLSPSCLGSPVPSPDTLSPLSFYSPSDGEPLSPSLDTPDGQILWPSQGTHYQSQESLVSNPGLFPDDAILSSSLSPCIGPHRARSRSSPPRPGPVASKAMIEANGRRRRHPAQFECPDCKQTFTALFSLKRHLQSHSGERPFECSIPGCSQRFYNSSDCKRHEKSKKRHKELLTQ